MDHEFFAKSKITINSFLLGSLFLGNFMAASPVDYVNPFIGTGGHGHTYPGATMPFGIQVSGTNILLNWATTNGQNYQIQYKDDLTAPNWIPLGSPVLGTGGFISVTNDINLST